MSEVCDESSAVDVSCQVVTEGSIPNMEVLRRSKMSGMETVRNENPMRSNDFEVWKNAD